ncbi:MAG: translocator protein [Thiomicrorhabdus sp.]|nr:MAG: translocator protein [Thiomicrorhabdus sp.]
MKEQKAKYSWHYYVMAMGALMAMLAGTLGSIGGIAAGLALAVVSHSALPFKTMTRFAFMIMFTGLYIFSFPDPEVVRDIMSGQHIPMEGAISAAEPESTAPKTLVMEDTVPTINAPVVEADPIPAAQ